MADGSGQMADDGLVLVTGAFHTSALCHLPSDVTQP